MPIRMLKVAAMLIVAAVQKNTYHYANCEKSIDMMKIS